MKKIILSQSEYFELQDFVYKTSGLYFSLLKKEYLETKITNRLEQLRIKNLSDYFQLLRQQDPIELNVLFDEITINETYFFRDMPQFQALKKIIAEHRGKIQQLNILSAGCSSGEEPYSLAILLHKYFPSVEYQIYALDISENVIAQAYRGEYGEYALKNTPQKIVNEYFSVSHGIFRVKDFLKERIIFKKFNLLDFGVFPFFPSFDLIFCRYVFIYFSEEVKRRVIQNFQQSMNSESYLFIGISEALGTFLEGFSLLHFPGAIIYKKRSSDDRKD